MKSICLILITIFMVTSVLANDEIYEWALIKYVSNSTQDDYREAIRAAEERCQGLVPKGMRFDELDVTNLGNPVNNLQIHFICKYKPNYNLD